jgi:hypothetical protein
MATPDTTADATRTPDLSRTTGPVSRAAERLTTETKSFLKTSEWWSYLAVVIAILIAGAVVGENGARDDFFAADKVWLYITILTVGYLVSRGIAKSGVRDPYYAERGDRNADH